MRIGKRDEALLGLMARYGILSTTQIQARFFPGVAKTTVLRRLRLLEETEFIRRVRGLPDAELAWVITKLGSVAARVEANPPKYTNQNVIRHEVKLTHARMLLERLGLGENFTPEFELKRRLAANDIHAVRERQVPDGLFLANCEGVTKTVALELELTTKAWPRYKKVVTEYEKKEKLDFVWYLTGDHRISRLLMPLWKKRSNLWKGPELLMSSLYELERDGASTIVFHSDGPNRPLSSVFDLKPPLKNSAMLEQNYDDPPDYAGAHGVSSFESDPVSGW